jgi:hypothetical protein
MFHRQCEEKGFHDAHTYTKQWAKAELKQLLHPELYPEEWEVVYMCRGIATPLPLAVDYLHADCTPCEACGDMAADALYRNDSDLEVWRELGPGESVTHMAEVRRL